MGVDRSSGDLRGLLVPDPRITIDTLVSKTDATVPSDYTEAGPHAGPAEADQDTNLVLRTSGDQSADGDIEVRTQRSGGVGLEAAGYVWRDVAAGETTSQYKGLDAPALITDWEALHYTTIADGKHIRPHVIRLLSGKLLAAFGVTTLGVVRIRRYDPADSSWTSVNLAPTGAGTGYITGAVTLCQLGSGRVLAYCLANDQQQIDVYVSDDDGDNWSPGGYRVLEEGVSEAAVTDVRVAYSPESSEVLLFALWDNSGTAEATATQYASADLGSNFVKVLEDWEVTTSESIETLDVVPMVGGGFCVVYIDEQPVNDDLKRRRIGSAFDPIDTATAAEPDGSIDPALDDVTTWRDEDDVMWLICGDAYAASKNRVGVMYRSIDQGDTWEDAADCQGTHALHTGTTTTNRLTRYSAMSVAGRTALVTRWTAAGSSHDPMSVGVVWYGGFSTHTAPAAEGLAQQDYRDTDYIGFGAQRSGAHRGGVWFPAEVPTSVDWSGNGAGSEALTGGALEVTTTAGQEREFGRTITDDSVKAVFLDFEVELDDGDGSTSAEEVTLTVRLSDNSYQYEVQVRCSSSGYQLYDVNAAGNVGSSQTFDLTSKGHIRLALDDAGEVRSWHGRGGHVRAYTEGASASGLTDGGAGATNLVRWGHTGVAANVSRWTLVGYCFWPGRWSGTQTGTLASSWTNPNHLKPRNYPTSPAHLYDGIKIAAVSGPTWYAETQRLKTAYEYPLRAVLPAHVPSPGTGWQSIEDDKDYELVWDLESEAGYSDSFFESSSLGCFLVDSNLRRCKLQGWDGAAWQDILSLDASDGYDQLAYTRKGRTLYPDIGGAAPTAERWSFHGMHAGDSIELDDGESQISIRSARPVLAAPGRRQLASASGAAWSPKRAFQRCGIRSPMAEAG